MPLSLRRLRLSFRARLLLALVASVGALLLATVAAIRVQTRRQVNVAVQRSLAQSRQVFAQQESDLREGLASDANRWLQSNRIPAVLDDALLSGTVDVLVQTTDYEIKLARRPEKLTLHAYTDATGRPVASALGPALLPHPGDGVPATAAWLLGTDSADAFGYHLMGSRLFAAYTTRVESFGNPIGTLTLGTMVTDSVARAAGQAIGAEVCFVAAGRCVASTGGEAARGLNRRMVEMAGARQPRRVRWEGRRFVLLADRVSTGAGMADVWRVVALPLDGLLGPFESIQRAAVLAGLGALVLALLLGVVLSRSFARPVRALVRATARVARGDYSVRVTPEHQDELGALADAFNEMTHGLMLKERYRGVLDKVVSPEVADELLKGEITLGGETRRVVTLFADVRGFTAMTEGMEPQRVVEVLNAVMERATAAVESQGGVVDKFVGDAVMAVFGAPVSRGGDADRAVRAALGICAALEELNAERAARGEPAVLMGVGINAGPAVAGNMGSPGRLNYTVLGESVNVAARLCDLAAPGEVLVTAALLAEVQAPVETNPRGAVAVRGLTASVDVHAITGIRPAAASGDAGRDADRAPSPAPASAGVAAALVAALALSLASTASAARAQSLPTLQELGIGWTSSNGVWQVTPSGRIDLEAYAPGDDAPGTGLIPETKPFVAGRASLFVDVFAGKHAYALVEGRVDRGEAPSDHGVSARVEQAYLRLLPLASGAVSVQAGKFVSPFGGYPQRHHTSADPFIRPPLPYDYRTVISTFFISKGPAGFVTWKDNPAMFRRMGAPPVWAAPYQVGAMAAAAWKGLSGRVAVMNSAPSSEPPEWDRLGAGEHGPSYVAHAGLQVTPELRIGVSFDQGSYLRDETVNAPLPAGEGVDHFDQRLWGFEAAFARGPVEARGEYLHDSWDMPNVPGYPTDQSFYAEAKVKLSAGLFAAARYGGIRFDRVENGAGGREPWDYAVDRLQLGAGYRLGRTTEVRAEYMLNRTDAPSDPSDNLFALRWSWTF